MNLEDVSQGLSVYHVAHPGRLGVLTGKTLDALFPMAEVHWGGNAEFMDVSKLAVFDPNSPRDSDTNVKRGKVAADLPSGFLSTDLTANPTFKRVPYAFPFRTSDNRLDFVLIPVHLQPGPGKANRTTRQRELKGLADWINLHSQSEKDFIILGDMNIENSNELTNVTPTSFISLNHDCLPTNTNVNDPKPYDHVMYRPAFTGSEVDPHYGFKVQDLIQAMRPHWKVISKKAYPGAPVYKHNIFRQYYSDHHPVDFVLTSAPGGDDD